jgi:hypothetical protein
MKGWELRVSQRGIASDARRAINIGRSGERGQLPLQRNRIFFTLGYLASAMIEGCHRF